MSAWLVVISGPSGVGKGTVIAEVRRRRPDLWFSVSATTRAPRPGEVDGVHYTFVDDAEFDRMIRDDELLEYASYAGQRSGTPRLPVADKLAAGTSVLLDIDVQGARQVKARLPEALLVFLVAPSWAELERRLRERRTEDDAAIARRLATARVELAAEGEFDAVVVNDEVGQAAQAVLTLISEPAPSGVAPPS